MSPGCPDLSEPRGRAAEPGLAGGVSSGATSAPQVSGAARLPERPSRPRCDPPSSRLWAGAASSDPCRPASQSIPGALARDQRAQCC